MLNIMLLCTIPQGPILIGVTFLLKASPVWVAITRNHPLH